MLVLTRQTDGKTDKSKITIATPTGDEVEISLFGQDSKEQVKVGIVAPKSYTVLRNELRKNDARGLQKPLD